VHRVINYNTGSSCGFLFGNIESLHCITTESPNKQKLSNKYYFNKEKRLVRSIQYDTELNVIQDKSYYRFGDHETPSILKKGNEYYHNVKYESQIDTISKSIIVKKLNKDRLEELDSIYYTGEFRPISIKKYSEVNELISKTKVEYDKKKVSLVLTIYKSGYVSGSKRSYDNKQRFIYQRSVSSANFETVEYILNESKEDFFDWKSDSFIYHRTHYKDTITYNLKTRLLIRKTRTSKTTIRLSEDLNPIDIETIFFSKPNSIKQHLTYNIHGDIETRTFESEYRSERNESYTYKYDHRDNWVEKKMFKNNNLIKTIERKIKYY